MPGLKNLRILSISRNAIKKIEKLDDVAGTLTEIWASYNFVSNLDGLHNLTNLEVLYVSGGVSWLWCVQTEVVFDALVKEKPSTVLRSGTFGSVLIFFLFSF